MNTADKRTQKPAGRSRLGRIFKLRIGQFGLKHIFTQWVSDASTGSWASPMKIPEHQRNSYKTVQNLPDSENEAQISNTAYTF